MRTLTRSAHLVYYSPISLADEIKHLHDVFQKKNYKQHFVSRNYCRDNGPNSTNARPTTATMMTVPSKKDKKVPNDIQGTVSYKIKCCDFPATYVGETGRNLNTRLTEHKSATKNGDNKNNIAEHHLQTDHRIDWNSAECISSSTDYYHRHTLERWFTNLERTPLNRCQQLPAPYK